MDTANNPISQNLWLQEALLRSYLPKLIPMLHVAPQALLIPSFHATLHTLFILFLSYRKLHAQIRKEKKCWKKITL